MVAWGLVTSLAADARAQTGSSGEESAVVVPTDTTVETLFADFLHFAKLGRFTIADAYARALFAHPELNPLAIREIAHRDRDSIQTLLVIVKNSTIGDRAASVLNLIEEGENLKRQDLDRILANIELLGGDPQQEFIATRRLVESGEYAIPPLVLALQDEAKRRLWARIASALPKIGKPAVGPLVMALRTDDNNARLTLIRSLGEIGYPQAVPYLLRVIRDESPPRESREAAKAAIARIEDLSGRSSSGGLLADQFVALADRYYREDDAVRADPRLAEANVWYWDEAIQALKRVAVPQVVFGPIMAMRCCEESLQIEPNRHDAISLWLAANIRREARLGLNVESGDPDERGTLEDPTRPDAFPRALHFSQAAGPRYVHLVLGRAVEDQDTAVALGAIRALKLTAGASSLVGFENLKQPLTRALRFPDAVVRARAALALGAALPRSPFPDSEFVVPVLAEVVSLTGSEKILVVDADESNLNRVVAALRSGDRVVIGERDFYRGMQRIRKEFPNPTALVVSESIAEPGLAGALSQLRGEFRYAKTPVMVLSSNPSAALQEELVAHFGNARAIHAFADADSLEAALADLQTTSEEAPLPPELALSLALEAARTLRSIALSGRTVFDVGVAEPALVAALEARYEDLQTAAGAVLALIPTQTAQRSLAYLALDSGRADSLRIALFGSLTESGREHGNLLEQGQIGELVEMVRDEQDLTMRTAASQALGALNIASNEASEIIRSFYRG